MPSKRKTIAVVAGAAAAVGAAAYFIRRRRLLSEAEDDDAFTAPILSGAHEKSKVEVGMTKSPVCNDLSVENQLLAEALREIGAESPRTGPATSTASAVGTSSKGTMGDRKEFPQLGLSLTVPSPWKVREDLSPFPNVAMLTVWNEELVTEEVAQQPGSVPMIVLSVEDVRADNVNLDEFKDRCKELAVSQMMMMSGGAIEPKVSKNTSTKVGPFRHMLEYSQSLPPFCDIVVLNLIEVRGSVAYTFQIMGSPDVMQRYRSMFMDIANNVRIESNISTALGYVELLTGSVKVDIDTTWVYEYPGGDGALAVMTTTSPTKKEEIGLYHQGGVPVTPHKLRSEKVMDGVEVQIALDGKQEKKTFTYNGYSLVVKPLQKSNSYLDEQMLVSIVKSVSPSTAEPKPKKGGTFVNKEHGYRVNVVGGSRLVASRIGGGSVAYAPQGLDGAEGGDHPPTVTMRVGTPENDPECMGSVEEWEARMRQEAEEGGIRDIARTTVNGEPCLTFISQSMEEIMPGQRMEIRGKVFIFVREGRTTLIRWEMAVGLWKKFERDMNAFVESLEFI
ncbi:Proteasome maturation protein 10 [Trypanosoma brucei equiperdum]|uniref:Proteasome maturation protein 10 n=1 Tax=Trypanosoma brucei equiperdum TaxID=630700 RepID=A0A3L6KT14_9TRYP|nr:Proteasome maturation protein 10 [Trypanosoma brucei equiperdum]